MALTEGQIIGLVIVLIIMTLLYLNPTWVTAIQNMLSPPVPGTGSTGTTTGSKSTGTTTGSGSTGTTTGSTGTTPPPTPPVRGPAYTNIGCYVDTCGACDPGPTGDQGGPTDAGWNCPGRSLPNFYRRYDQQPVYPIDKCYQVAKAGGNKYFGQQFGTECWAGNDLSRAQSAGVSTNCNRTGGNGSCVNDIYQINY